MVSISAKPRAAASAASAASSAGFSFRFVTCAWFAGARRARSFFSANISSTGSSIAIDARQPRRRQPAREPHELGARDVDVDQHARDLGVVERRRLGGDVEVEAVARRRSGRARPSRLRGRPSSSTTRPRLDRERRLRVVRPVHRDEAERGAAARSAARGGARAARARAKRLRMLPVSRRKQAALGVHLRCLADEGGGSPARPSRSSCSAHASSSAAVERRGRSAV